MGKTLAEKLSYSFIDTDALVVAHQRMSIKEIVGQHGWEGFRGKEHAILKEVSTSDGQVVATGGGIVLNDELDDFTAAMERIVAGLEKKNRLLNEHERRVTAYHEMGHALVARALPGTDPVHKVSIIPRGIGALEVTVADGLLPGIVEGGAVCVVRPDRYVAAVTNDLDVTTARLAAHFSP